MNTPEIVTLEQIAEHYGCTERNARHMRSKGGLRYEMIQVGVYLKMNNISIGDLVTLIEAINKVRRPHDS